MCNNNILGDLTKMKTWLFTWNVDRWSWDDELTGYKEMIKEIDQVGCAFSKWTCGMNKSVHIGDRIFLIKLGSEPKGIVASGYAATDVFEGIHWDEDKRNEGKSARRVYIKFDKIIDYNFQNILPIEELKSMANNYKWSTQISGIEIPSSIAAELESKWNDI